MKNIPNAVANGSLNQVAPKDANAPRWAARREPDSSELFADSKVLLIRHKGMFYALRRTANGKLILTK